VVTRERFAQGLTLAQYLGQMRMNRERFVQFMERAEVDGVTLTTPGRALKVLVITEDWCGDSLYQFPVLARLAEGNPDVELRVFLRDQNPDVMNQFLKRGLYRTIPVFAFFDEQMNELARFIERPASPGEPLAQHLRSLLGG
jgi:thioredoxin family protein